MKNTNAVSALLFSALAAAVPLQKRAYKTNTLTVVELATVTTVVTLSGPLPSGAKGYSPEEVAQLTKQAVPTSPSSAVAAAASTTSSLSSVDWNTVPMFPTIAPPEANAQANPAPYPSSSSSSSSSSTSDVPVVPVVTPSAQPPAATTAPVSVTSTAAAPSGGAGGSGGANPYFPNGPRVGEKASNVRLSPFMAYWAGQSIENHIGACGHAPYLDTDPQLAKSDSKGDKKFMLHPPVISGNKYEDIFQYCGAILEVTGPDGVKTTGTVVDLCEDCGGPGGIDMMKANWDEVGASVADGDCVYGASWTLTGWIHLLPAL